MRSGQRDAVFDHRPFGHSDRQNFEARHLLQLSVIIESEFTPVDRSFLAEIEERSNRHRFQPDDRVPHPDLNNGTAGASQRQSEADCQSESSKHESVATKKGTG